MIANISPLFATAIPKSNIAISGTALRAKAGIATKRKGMKNMADLIDRQEAIRIVRELKTVHFDGMETYETGRNDAIEVIAGVLLKEMPSVEPDRKRGKWKFNPNGMDWGIAAWTCSECGSKNDMIPAYVETRNGPVRLDNPFRFAGSRYCPCCGARMVDYE